MLMEPVGIPGSRWKSDFTGPQVQGGAFQSRVFRVARFVHLRHGSNSLRLFSVSIYIFVLVYGPKGTFLIPVPYTYLIILTDTNTRQGKGCIAHSCTEPLLTG